MGRSEFVITVAKRAIYFQRGISTGHGLGQSMMSKIMGSNGNSSPKLWLLTEGKPEKYG